MDEQLALLKKLNRRTRFTQFLAWLALFFTAVGIAAGYKNWLRIHDKAKLALRQIEEIKQELPNLALKEKLAELERDIHENFNVNKSDLDKAMIELKTIQNSTQLIADSVYAQAEELTKQQPAIQIKTPTLKDWSLGEVHFLLQTAVQQFVLKRDKQSAISSLKLADNLLLERGELDLLPVRKKITEDIATLNQFNPVDVGAVSEKIDALLQALKPQKTDAQVNSTDIQLLPSDAGSATQDNSATDESLVNRMKKTINDAVIIKRHDKPVVEGLDFDGKERLFQLFSLRFEALKVLLLKEDNVNYQKQIELIRSLLKESYAKEQSDGYLAQLDELSAVNLSPVLPEVNRSLQLLEKLMSEKNKVHSSSDSALSEQN